MKSHLSSNIYKPGMYHQDLLEAFHIYTQIGVLDVTSAEILQQEWKCCSCNMQVVI